MGSLLRFHTKGQAHIARTSSRRGGGRFERTREMETSRTTIGRKTGGDHAAPLTSHKEPYFSLSGFPRTTRLGGL